MRILFFGTYEGERQPRVRALQEGFAEAGDDVAECNVPLGISTADRVRMVRRPWMAAAGGARVARSWAKLWRRARALPNPDAVVVGYLGHFDVHLARRLWPSTPIVLDHLVSAADTARDRGATSGAVLRALERVDEAAVRAADIVLLDTDESAELLPAPARDRSLVVPVGAETRWFHAPARRPAGPLKVIFYGLFTPLQGATVIGEAIALLAGEPDIKITMVGEGQDLEAARRAAGGAAHATWPGWVAPAELPALVAGHDVCLGIFGTTPKALRVVPHKVYEGAASGCAIVTSDTAPQRRALGDAAVLLTPGDPKALAEELRGLASDRGRVEALRDAAFRRAESTFRPHVVVEPLRRRLDTLRPS